MSGTSSPRRVELDEKRAKQISDGLDKVFKAESTPRIPFDPAREKVVIFSDLHKGTGDDADDFRNCEHAFTMALGWYLDNDYKLFMLGDCEELWEESPQDVIKRYGEVLALEAQFVQRGGLARFWGNHDDLWRHADAVQEHLRPIFGDGLQVHEGLRLEVAGGAGTIFFAHGHQGTLSSDKWSGPSRWFVRNVWRRIQRKTGFSATPPSRDVHLRAQHDLAMTRWAGRRGVLLVAGHTHRPVFADSKPKAPPTRTEAELESALGNAGSDEERAAIHGELEYARTANRRPATAVTVDPPCYFNTGCCAFQDGDITGLEIADQKIRLVRWPAVFSEICGSGEPGISGEKRCLEGASRPLDEVLAAIRAAAGTEPAFTEYEIRPG